MTMIQETPSNSRDKTASKDVSHGKFKAQLTWTPAHGVLVDTMPNTKLSSQDLRRYSDFLDSYLREENQKFEEKNQKSFLDLSEFGLELRKDLQPSTEHTEIWVKPGTSTLEFGTLFLSWHMPLPYRSPSSPNRFDGRWQLQVNGLKDSYLRDSSSLWDNEEEVQKLAEKVLHDEGSLILELSLSQTEEIQQYASAWNRSNAAANFLSQMTTTQHTPYTSVAKKLKDALGRNSSRSRYSKTVVVPLSLPNNKAPAVLISYYDENVAARGREALSRTTLQEVTDLPSFGVREGKIQVWAKDASIFARATPDNGMWEWLQYEALAGSRRYSHHRKAYV